MPTTASADLIEFATECENLATSMLVDWHKKTIDDLMNGWQQYINTLRNLADEIRRRESARATEIECACQQHMPADFRDDGIFAGGIDAGI